MVSYARTALKGGFLLALLNYLNLVIRIFISILIVSYLGPELYGIRGVLITTQSLIFSQIVSFLVIPFTRELSVKMASQNNSDYNLVLSTVFVVTTMLGLTGCFLYVILGFSYLSALITFPKIKFLIVMTGLMIPLQSFLTFMNEILRSELRYIRLAVSTNLRNFLDAFLVILIILSSKFTLETLFIVNFVSVLTSNVVSFSLIYSVVRKHSFQFNVNLEYIKYFFKKSSQYEIGSIVNNTFYNFDSLVLPNFLELKYIGFYYFSKSLLKFFLNGIRSAKALFLPTLSMKTTTNKAKAREYVVTSLSISLFIINSTVLPFIIFSKQILSMISMILHDFESYTPSYLIVSAMMIYTICFIFQYDIIIYSDSLGKFHRHIKAGLISLTTYIVLIFTFNAIKTNYITSQYITALFFVIIFNLGLIAKNFYWYKMAKEDNLNIPIKKLIISESVLITLAFSFLQYNYIAITTFIEVAMTSVLLILCAIAFIIIQLFFGIITAEQILILHKIVRRKNFKKIIGILLALALKLQFKRNT